MLLYCPTSSTNYNHSSYNNKQFHTHIDIYSVTPKSKFGKVSAFMTMANLKQLFSFIILLFLSLGRNKHSMADDVIREGVVLDLNSTVGEVAESYILMAISDFYAVKANYRTRLSLFTGILRMMLLVRHVQVTIILTHILKG